MPRKTGLNQAQDLAIAERLPSESATELAQEFGVSRSTIYRAAGRVGKTEQIAESNAPLGEWGSTGLQRFGGSVRDDYARVWQSLQDYVPLVKEMTNHASIASVLFSVEMYLRNAKWEVLAVSQSKEDQEGAEFLESNMLDMSHSWGDLISQALSMLPYGFAPFEICYKKRQGPQGRFPSKHSDGRIGWRKIAFRSQDSLSPGHEWEFDENGGVQGMYQMANYSKPEVFIPIEKMLLFRTTAAKGTPQGKSVLRPVYEDWYYSKAFKEIEGISAERLGSGLPVMYLGHGTNRGSQAGSDFNFAQQVVRDIRSDEQSGVVVPHPKMTSDGTGALLELLSPPAKGAVDFNQTILRYNQSITQSLLAQIVWLGVSGFGSQSLAVELQRIFEQAITAWGKSIADVINRFGVPRLFQYNTFQISDYPRFDVIPPKNIDLMATINAINTAVAGGLIPNDESVQKKTRELLQIQATGDPGETVQPSTAETVPEPEQTQAFSFEAVALNQADSLSDRLVKIYRNWTGRISGKLVDASPRKAKYRALSDQFDNFDYDDPHALNKMYRLSTQLVEELAIAEPIEVHVTNVITPPEVIVPEVKVPDIRIQASISQPDEVIETIKVVERGTDKLINKTQSTKKVRGKDA